MFNLNIQDFQREVENLQELFDKMMITDEDSKEYKSLSEKYDNLRKKVQNLRDDFHFIITAVKHTSAGRKIICLHNDWNRLGRENPIAFLGNNGVFLSEL